MKKNMGNNQRNIKIGSIGSAESKAPISLFVKIGCALAFALIVITATCFSTAIFTAQTETSTTVTFSSVNVDIDVPISKGEDQSMITKSSNAKYISRFVSNYYNDEDANLIETVNLKVPEGSENVYVRIQAQYMFQDQSDSNLSENMRLILSYLNSNSPIVTAQDSDYKWVLYSDGYYYLVARSSDTTPYVAEAGQSFSFISNTSPVLYRAISKLNLDFSTEDKALLEFLSFALNVEVVQEVTSYATIASLTTSVPQFNAGISQAKSFGNVLYFDSNGGSKISAIFTESASYDVSSISPEKVGNTFVSWQGSALSSNVVSFASGNVQAIQAQWSINTYTISYKDQNNEDFSGSTTGLPTQYTYGTKVNLPNTTTKVGHTFVGWYQDPSCTELIDSISATSTGNVTVYALWKPNTMTISYQNLGSGVLVGSNYVDSFPYGSTQTITLPQASKFGYDFLGWTFASNGSGDKLQILDLGVDNRNKNNIVLYAYFEARQYTITYDANLGTFGTGISNTQVYSASQNFALLPATACTMTSYTLLGWKVINTDGESNWQLNSVCLPHSAFTQSPHGYRYGNVTLRAEWGFTSSLISVRFYDNNVAIPGRTYTVAVGSVMNIPQDIFPIASGVVSSPSGVTVPKADKVLAGWALSQSATVAQFTDTYRVNQSDEDGTMIKLHAVWKDVSYYAVVKSGSNYDLYGVSTDRVTVFICSANSFQTIMQVADKYCTKTTISFYFGSAVNAGVVSGDLNVGTSTLSLSVAFTNATTINFLNGSIVNTATALSVTVASLSSSTSGSVFTVPNGKTLNVGSTNGGLLKVLSKRLMFLNAGTLNLVNANLQVGESASSTSSANAIVANVATTSRLNVANGSYTYYLTEQGTPEQNTNAMFILKNGQCVVNGGNFEILNQGHIFNSCGAIPVVENTTAYMLKINGGTFTTIAGQPNALLTMSGGTRVEITDIFAQINGALPAISLNSANDRLKVTGGNITATGPAGIKAGSDSIALSGLKVELSGCVLNYTGTTSDASALIARAGSNITISDADILSTIRGFFQASNSSATLNNVRINATDSAIYTYGSLTINGGSHISSAEYIALYMRSVSVVTLNGNDSVNALEVISDSQSPTLTMTDSSILNVSGKVHIINTHKIKATGESQNSHALGMSNSSRITISGNSSTVLIQTMNESNTSSHAIYCNSSNENAIVVSATTATAVKVIATAGQALNLVSGKATLNGGTYVSRLNHSVSVEGASTQLTLAGNAKVSKLVQDMDGDFTPQSKKFIYAICGSGNSSPNIVIKGSAQVLSYEDSAISFSGAGELRLQIGENATISSANSYAINFDQTGANAGLYLSGSPTITSPLSHANIRFTKYGTIHAKDFGVSTVLNSSLPYVISLFAGLACVDDSIVVADVANNATKNKFSITNPDQSLRYKEAPKTLVLGKVSSVSYDLNGGSSTDDIVDNTHYVSGDTVTVIFNPVPTRPSYAFVGWSTSKYTSIPQYTSSGVTTFTMGDSSVTLYAVWQIQYVKMYFGTNSSQATYYYSLEDAMLAYKSSSTTQTKVTFEMLKSNLATQNTYHLGYTGTDSVSDKYINHSTAKNVVIKATSSNFVLYSYAMENSFRIGNNYTLTVENITIDGASEAQSRADACRFAYVGIGSTLTLKAGATLQNFSFWNNASGADSVGGCVFVEGGTLTMESGSLIYNTSAKYSNAGAVYTRAGGGAIYGKQSGSTRATINVNYGASISHCFTDVYCYYTTESGSEKRIMGALYLEGCVLNMLGNISDCHIYAKNAVNRTATYTGTSEVDKLNAVGSAIYTGSRDSTSSLVKLGGNDANQIATIKNCYSIVNSTYAFILGSVLCYQGTLKTSNVEISGAYGTAEDCKGSLLRGGAFYLEYLTSVQFKSGTVIRDCVAKEGSAVYALESPIQFLNNCNMSGSSSHTVILRRCTHTIQDNVKLSCSSNAGHSALYVWSDTDGPDTVVNIKGNAEITGTNLARALEIRKNPATVNISGNVKLSAVGNRTIQHMGTGTLNITSSSVEIKNTSNNYVIYCGGQDSTDYIGKLVLDITAGTIINTNTGNQARAISLDNLGNVKIEGGTIQSQGTKETIYVGQGINNAAPNTTLTQTRLSIEGGTIRNTNTGAAAGVIIFDVSYGNMSISGGTITSAGDANTIRMTGGGSAAIDQTRLSITGGTIQNTHTTGGGARAILYECAYGNMQITNANAIVENASSSAVTVRLAGGSAAVKAKDRFKITAGTIRNTNTTGQWSSRALECSADFYGKIKVQGGTLTSKASGNTIWLDGGSSNSGTGAINNENTNVTFYLSGGTVSNTRSDGGYVLQAKRVPVFVTGGTIDGTNHSGVRLSGNNSYMKVTGGTFNNKQAIYFSGDVTTDIGTVDIQGGVFNAGTFIRVVNQTGVKTANISNGTINGTFELQGRSTINISGGTFGTSGTRINKEFIYSEYNNASAPSTINITGGTFWLNKQLFKNVATDTSRLNISGGTINSSFSGTGANDFWYHSISPSTVLSIANDPFVFSGSANTKVHVKGQNQISAKVGSNVYSGKILKVHYAYATPAVSQVVVNNVEASDTGNATKFALAFPVGYYLDRDGTNLVLKMIQYKIVYNRGFALTPTIADTYIGYFGQVGETFNEKYIPHDAFQFIEGFETLTVGQNKTIAQNGYRRVGYTFNGWSPVLNGSETTVQPGNSLLVTSNEVNSISLVNGSSNINITGEFTPAICSQNAKTLYVRLYATWEAETYTITFKDGNTTLEGISSHYGDAITRADPTKSGYRFEGWLETKEISGKIYTRVFYHNPYNTNGASNLNNVKHGIFLPFKSDSNDVLSVQNTNDDVYRFSALDKTESIKNSSKPYPSAYTYYLEYDNPLASTSSYYINFRQNTNPTVSSDNTVAGFTLIGSTSGIAGLTNNFKGLNYNGGPTFIDGNAVGSTNPGNWFYAIGHLSDNIHDKGVPALEGYSGRSSTSFPISLWQQVGDGNLANMNVPYYSIGDNNTSQKIGMSIASGSGTPYYVKGATTLTALWSKVTYEVYFNDGGSSSLSTSAAVRTNDLSVVKDAIANPIVANANKAKLKVCANVTEVGEYNLAFNTNIKEITIEGASSSTVWKVNSSTNLFTFGDNAGQIATVQNLTIDQNRTSASAGRFAHVGLGCTLTIGTGATLKKFYMNSDFNGLIWAKGGTVNLEGGTITENSTEGNGTAISGYDYTLKISSGTISSNTARNNHGGAIYMSGPDNEFLMTGGTITKNKVERVNSASNPSGLYGGAISLIGSGKATISGGTIKENKINFVLSASGTTGSQYFARGGGIHSPSGFSLTIKDGAEIISNEIILDSQSTNYSSSSTASELKGYGGGVYAEGTLNIGGSAKINSNKITVTSNGVSGNQAPVCIIARGGGVYSYSANAIINGANVQIDSNQVTGTASGTGPSRQETREGGGVYNGYKLTFNAGTISSNTGAIAGGGIYTVGNITNNINYGQFAMTGGTISGNTANEGGGISMNTNSICSISGGTISGNTASANGAGIFKNNSNSSGIDLTISGLTIQNNTAGASGGGIYLNNGDITMNSGTISGNNANNGSGGGVYVVSGKTFTMNGGTIGNASATVCATNSAGSRSNYASSDGGGVYSSGGNLTFASGVTIAYNYSGGVGGGICYSGNATKDFVLNGVNINYNFANGANGGGGVYVNGLKSFKVTGDTMIKGNTASERGGGIRSGIAFTMEGGTVRDNTLVKGSLGGGMYIASGTINASGSNTIEITANSAPNGSGGGIYTGGTITIGKATISSNTAKHGGGVYINAGGGSINNASALITSNTASGNGGGVHNKAGNLTMSNGTISANTAVDGAGMYIVAGNLTLSGGTIGGTSSSAKNTASGNGGGVYKAGSGTFTMSNGTISANGAVDGAGIYNAAGTFTMTGGTIGSTGTSATSNTATGNGGGVFVASGTTFEMKGGVIGKSGSTAVASTSAYANKASDSGGGIYNLGILKLTATATTYPQIRYNTSIKNAGSSGGGGIACVGTTYDIITTKNGTNIPLVTHNYGVRGGGLWINRDDTTNRTITAIKLIANNAAYGGGLDFDKGKLTLNGASADDVLIDSNTSTTGGGGIWCDKELIITSAKITNNTTSGSSGGGAIRTNNTTNSKLTIGTGATITGNRTTSNSGDGGAIYFNGNTLTISGGTISSNIGYRNGGGIFINAGATTISGGTISSNTNGISTGSGGGIYKRGSGLLTISGGTISSNTAKYDGGGIYVEAGAITISGGTISGNKASTSRYGGGVYKGGTGAFTMTGGKIGGTGTSVTANTAKFGGGVSVRAGTFYFSGGAIGDSTKTEVATNSAYSNSAQQGGGIHAYNCTVNIGGSAVIAYNRATYFGGGIHLEGTDVNITAGEIRYNLVYSTVANQGDANYVRGGGVNIQNSSCSFLMSAGSIHHNSVVRVASYTDATYTANKYPDIYGGGIASLGSSSTPITLSGTAKVQNNSLSNTITFTGASDSTTIREILARTYGAGIFSRGNTTLSDSVEISENSGSATCSGTSATLKACANNCGLGIYHDQGTLTMNGSDVKIHSNTYTHSATNSGGGGTSLYTVGGGVYTTRTFNMSAGAIYSHTVAHRGGGVYVDSSGGILNLSGGSIYSNSTQAGYGGGVVIASGRLNMTGGEIYSNTATGGNGGGVWSNKTIAMSAGSINNNSVTGNYHGGGIYADTTNANTSITGSAKIFGNDTPYRGGGIHQANGKLTINGANVEIYSNTAGTQGGGVSLNAAVVFKLQNGTIRNNSAADGAGLRVGWDCTTLENILMSGGTIRDNAATGAGGGVYLEAWNAGTGNANAAKAGSFKMTGGTISDNTAKSGAGIYANYASKNYNGQLYEGIPKVTITGGTITGNSATNGAGGGIHSYKGTLTMDGGTISSNTATINGGGVFQNGGTFTFNGGTIGDSTKTVVATASSYSNKAANGAGVYATNGSSLLIGTVFGIDKPYIAYNYSTGNGAGIYSAGSMQVNRGSIQYNYADTANNAHGGGVCIAHGNMSNISQFEGSALSNVEVKGNKAYRAAGIAITGANTTVTISGNVDATQIINNQATSVGGGIMLWQHAKLNFNGGAIESNTAPNGGGIGILQWSTVTINGGYVYANAATGTGASGRGGGVYIESWVGDKSASKPNGIDASSGNLYLRSGSIESNTALNGAGVYLSQCTNTYTNTNSKGLFQMIGGVIQNNIASTNGGGVWNNGTFDMIGGVIGDQNATVTASNAGYSNKAVKGGGVYVSSSGTMSLGDINLSLQALIIYNIAHGGSGNYGGGIYCDGVLTINRGLIRYNRATTYGGGIYKAGSGTFTMSNGTISANGAVDGAGMYISQGDVTLSGGTIGGTSSSAKNTASGNGGGVYKAGSGTFTFTRGSISGNIATMGSGVYLAGGTFNMLYNLDTTEIISSDNAHTVYINGGTFNLYGDYNTIIRQDKNNANMYPIYINNGHLNVCGTPRIGSSTCFKYDVFTKKASSISAKVGDTSFFANYYTTNRALATYGDRLMIKTDISATNTTIVNQVDTGAISARFGICSAGTNYNVWTGTSEKTIKIVEKPVDNGGQYFLGYTYSVVQTYDPDENTGMDPVFRYGANGARNTENNRTFVWQLVSTEFSAIQTALRNSTHFSTGANNCYIASNAANTSVSGAIIDKDSSSIPTASKFTLFNYNLDSQRATFTREDEELFVWVSSEFESDNFTFTMVGIELNLNNKNTEGIYISDNGSFISPLNTSYNGNINLIRDTAHNSIFSAFRADRATQITIKDMTVQDAGHYYTSGSVIYNAGAFHFLNCPNVTLSRVSVLNCGGYPGAIYSNNSTINMIYSYVRNSNCTESVLNIYQGNATISACEFTSNTTGNSLGGGGGAIECSSNANVTISETLIKGNRALNHMFDYGAGLNIVTNSSVTINEGTHIVDNEASIGGILIYNGKLVINNGEDSHSADISTNIHEWTKSAGWSSTNNTTSSQNPTSEIAFVGVGIVEGLYKAFNPQVTGWYTINIALQNNNASAERVNFSVTDSEPTNGYNAQNPDVDFTFHELQQWSKQSGSTTKYLEAGHTYYLNLNFENCTYYEWHSFSLLNCSIRRTAISRNTSDVRGGGISNTGKMIVNGALISDNCAPDNLALQDWYTGGNNFSGCDLSRNGGTLSYTGKGGWEWLWTPYNTRRSYFIPNPRQMHTRLKVTILAYMESSVATSFRLCLLNQRPPNDDVRDNYNYHYLADGGTSFCNVSFNGNDRYVTSTFITNYIDINRTYFWGLNFGTTSDNNRHRFRIDRIVVKDLYTDRVLDVFGNGANYGGGIYVRTNGKLVIQKATSASNSLPTIITGNRSDCGGGLANFGKTKITSAIILANGGSELHNTSNTYAQVNFSKWSYNQALSNSSPDASLSGEGNNSNNISFSAQNTQTKHLYRSINLYEGVTYTFYVAVRTSSSASFSLELLITAPPATDDTSGNLAQTGYSTPHTGNIGYKGYSISWYCNATRTYYLNFNLGGNSSYVGKTVTFYFSTGTSYITTDMGCYNIAQAHNTPALSNCYAGGGIYNNGKLSSNANVSERFNLAWRFGSGFYNESSGTMYINGTERGDEVGGIPFYNNGTVYGSLNHLSNNSNISDWYQGNDSLLSYQAPPWDINSRVNNINELDGTAWN